MLSAKEILYKTLSKKLTKNEAISLLISLVEESNDINERIECLEIFDKLSPKDEQIFKFLENIFLSDGNPFIKSAALKTLLHNFPIKCTSALKWAIKNKWSPVLSKTLLDELELSDYDDLKEIRVLLFNKLERQYEGIQIEDVKALMELQAMFYWAQSSFMNTEPEDGRVVGLDLSCLKLKKVPEIICSFSKLKYLDLSNNEITKIPEWICLFKDLETLNIGDNLFLSLPNCILTLKRLKKLKLFSRHSKLNNIPIVVLEFAKHKIVKKYLQLGVAPNEAYILGLLDIIGRSSLEKINYYLIHQIKQTQDCSCFKTDDKGHIIGVYIIGGEDISISLIPEQICELKYLEELNLSCNLINEIPESIGKLKYLKKLKLYNNSIQKIPESIGKLEYLKILDLSCNKIQKIPDSIGSLESLNDLNLSKNRIKMIPQSIGCLKSLKTLNIAGNKIKKLPNSIFSLKSLDCFIFNDNSFSNNYYENCNKRFNTLE